VSVNAIGTRARLAPAATSPRQTAAAAAATATAAPATAPAAASAAASTAAAPTAAAAASAGNPFAEPGRAGIFFVEYVERPQADVDDFLLAERDLRGGLPPRGGFSGRHSGRRGCTAGERQRHADHSQDRYGFLATLSLRGSLLMRHSRVLPYFRGSDKADRRRFLRLAQAACKTDDLPPPKLTQGLQAPEAAGGNRSRKRARTRPGSQCF
jgi:hypothetical protein